MSIKSVIAVILPLIMILGGMSLYGIVDREAQMFEEVKVGKVTTTATVIEIHDEKENGKYKYTFKYNDPKEVVKTFEVLTYEPLKMSQEKLIYCDDINYYIPPSKYDTNLYLSGATILIIGGVLLEIVAFVKPRKTQSE